MRAAYQDILGRPADAEGLAFWVSELDATGDLRLVEIGLLARWEPAGSS